MKGKGEAAIRIDVLTREHGLSERQRVALGHVMEAGKLSIQELESLQPGVQRRTLQRDLRKLQELGLIRPEGATRSLYYARGKGLA